MDCNALCLVSIDPSSRGEPLYRQKPRGESKETLQVEASNSEIWVRVSASVSYLELGTMKCFMIPEEGGKEAKCHQLASLDLMVVEFKILGERVRLGGQGPATYRISTPFLKGLAGRF
jgi:hypothetical protein